MEATEFYKKITDKVIDALERGTAPWTRPWRSHQGLSTGQPVNAVTGRAYQGVNALSLALSALSSGHTDLRFATFKQARKKGWGIRKGAAGLPVIKLVSPRPKTSGPSSGEIRAEKDPEGPASEHDRKEERAQGDQKKYERLIPRIYYVFSSADMVGIPAATQGAGEEESPERVSGSGERPEARRYRRQLSEKLGVAVHHGGDRACYDREKDEILLPREEDFESCEGYLGTLFHEFGHATGHETRLNRSFGVWGESTYAFEELVAELASLFVGMRTGVSPDEKHFQNHAAYVGHWIEALRNDRKALIRASTLAQEACNLLLEALAPFPEKGEGGDTDVSFWLSRKGEARENPPPDARRHEAASKDPVTSPGQGQLHQPAR